MTSTPTARRPLGDSGIAIAPLSLGGNVFGWTADRDASFAVLDAFVDGGGDLIDTADGYSAWVDGNSGGESETIIGGWLRASGRRDDVLIATKVSTHPEFRGLAPSTVRRAAEASLHRLGTDRIDLYYAHFDDESVPIEETVAAFSALVDDGLVRAIALSNYAPDRIDAWFAATAAGGHHRAVALQPQYSLVERGFEGALRGRAEAHGLAVLPYSALASGFLTGKYRSADARGDSPRAGSAAKYLDARGERVLDALDDVAAAHGTSVTAVALAWLRDRPTIAAPIASARGTGQLEALLASLHLELAPEEQEHLTAASETTAD